MLRDLTGPKPMRPRTARPRPHVTPEAVVTAALEILDAEGMDGVTFRAVARKLGVQAPALYWHFVDKRDLMDDLSERILVSGGLGSLPRPSKPSEWRPWLADRARTLRAALIAHRDGGRVVAGARFFRARALARLALVSGVVLQDAGFGVLEAGLATATVVDYVWGFVIEEQEGTGPPPGVSEAEWQRRFLGVEAVQDLWGVDPRTARLAGAMIEERKRHSDDELFEWGLDAILDGLERARRAGKRAGPRPTRA